MRRTMLAKCGPTSGDRRASGGQELDCEAGRVIAPASCAVIDVDEIRQLVISGHPAPWEGQEGHRQLRLGVENGCTLARRFLDHGIEVVIADVLTPETVGLYRRLLPDLVVVHLQVLTESRSTTRFAGFAWAPWSPARLPRVLGGCT
jgi:hypothetical protein